jgi:hypothetical protein
LETNGKKIVKKKEAEEYIGEAQGRRKQGEHSGRKKEKK